MRSLLFSLLFLLLATFSAGAADPISLSDATFLVEEAFRADAPVLQHAFGFSERAWNYTLTHEWAGTSPHLVGYSVPLELGERGGEVALGAASLDYRYQAGGRDEDVFGFAPRMSLIVPLTSGAATGVAVSAPLTVRHGSRVASHWNVGGSWTPEHDSIASREAFAGAAIARVLNQRTVGVVEATVTWTQEIFDGSPASRSRAIVVSPGIRRAIDVAGYRLVPGIAIPLTIEGGDRSLDVAFHVMFENALLGD
ncbi:MAG: hypothetical protein ABR524_13125 [Thermoanaerobaculia bacterium]